MNYNNAAFIASYGLSSQLPDSDRAEIIFSGRSNVGKSSLINKVCNRKNLARVSSTPGKTATINFYEVDTSYLVDLPGYGYAKVSNAERRRWDNLINRYFEANRAHTLLVQLLDCRHAPSNDDMQMLEYLRYHNIPFMVALTKGDKPKRSQYARIQAEFEAICAPFGCKAVLLTSAEKGMGMDELREILNIAVAQAEEEAERWAEEEDARLAAQEAADAAQASEADEFADDASDAGDAQDGAAQAAAIAAVAAFAAADADASDAGEPQDDPNEGV